MADRRIVREETVADRTGRSRGPIIGLLIVLAVILVVLVLYLVSGDSEDDGDDIQVDDIDVQVGD